MQYLVLFCLLQFVHGQTGETVGAEDPLVTELHTGKGFSCNPGAPLCPDQGEYSNAGGNITLTIMEMRNLPNMDGFGAAGLTTDAFITAKIGNDERTSGEIPNSLNPKWEPCQEKYCAGEDDIVRDLNFGNRRAGGPILIRILDSDSGLEFDDDLIATFRVYVIYCSAFTATVQKTPHEEEDSKWAMPEQPLCVEEAWIPLQAGGECVLADGSITTEFPCVKLRQTVVPFQLEIEQVYVPNTLVNGGMAGYYDEATSRIYGRVYSDSDDRLMNYNRLQNAKGGILVRSSSRDNNNKGNSSTQDGFPYIPYARFTINYDADMYVFRRQSDMANQPEWLDASFGWTSTKEYAQLVGVVGDFGAVTKPVYAHVRNRYGDSLGAGEITGLNIRQDFSDVTSQMYFIILVARESFDPPPPIYSKEFGKVEFFLSCVQFGVLFSLFFKLSLEYLKRMRWRIDRVQSYLVSFAIDQINTTEAETKSVLNALFVCYNDSDKNIDFRRNLFYAKLAVKICVGLPIFVLFAWGVSIVTTVAPPTVGIFLVFIGLGTITCLYAIVRWRDMGWRMTPFILTLFMIAFGCAFLFLLSSTFVDPKVYNGGANVDFFALSAVFLTMNMIPMIWLAFTNDTKIMKSLNQVLAVVTASEKMNVLKNKFKRLGAMGLKLGMMKGEIDRPRGEKPKSPFFSLVGDNYSVVKSIPGFELADILQNAFVVSANSRARNNMRCYASSLFILLVYAIISYVSTDFPSQGFGILFTIIVLDSSMALLLRGNLSWSAGYIVYLMSLCRGCLVITGGQYWLLGQSLLYMVFGTALCKEIIGKNLPRMSKQEAGGITFFGHNADRRPLYDVSTSPEFVLAYLSFFFVFLLLVVVFTTNDPADFVTLPVFGQDWALWIFGLLGFVLVLFYGVALGTSRAFFLMKEQLLSEYAANAYLFFKKLRLPFMLAAASELLVVCSGLFLFASTGSTFIFIVSIFFPVILLLSLIVYAQWRKNDYRMIVWPPVDEEVEEDDDEFDEEAEYEKEAEAQRENFVLPSLTAVAANGENSDDFKMPALPLKGALLAKVAGAKDEKQEKNENSKAKPNPEETKSANDPAAEAKDVAETNPDVGETGEEAENNEAEQLEMGKAKSKARSLCFKCPLGPFNKYKLAKVDDDGGENDEVDFNTMPVLEAFRQGYLLPEDYAVIASLALLLFVVFVFGVILSITETPSWFGNVIWVGFFVVVFTISPVIKWFNIRVMTTDMRYSFIFSAILAWSSGFTIFFQVLKSNVNDVESLVVLSILIMYPIFVLLITTVLKWKDDGWVITDFIRISLPICLVFLVLWIFEMYAWLGVAFGGILTFSLLAFLSVLYFLTKWIDNEFYVAPRDQRLVHRALCVCMAVFFGIGIFAGQEFYGFSIALIVLQIKLSCNIIGSRMTREPEVQNFYSPYIFPIYAYDARTNNLIDDNYETRNIYILYAVAFYWGALGILFTDPLGFGIGLCSLVLISVAGTSAHLCCITPVKMGIASKYVNEGMLKAAGQSANTAFLNRRTEIPIECAEFIQLAQQEKIAEIQFQQVAAGKPTDDAAALAEAAKEKPVEERICAAELALKLDDYKWKCTYAVLEGKDVRRNDSLFTVKDAIMETFRAGRGPFGYFGGFGYPYWIYLKSGRANTNPFYTDEGQYQNPLLEDEALVDTIKYLKELPKIDATLDKEFLEETRCIIHFQLLVMNAADARLGRETILFQKFLRENRFKLMSNGINPPSDIFKTSSFASIDIPLVAVWLVSLTPEERERFHNLKLQFSDEMERKDAMIKTEDDQTLVEQTETLQYLKEREAMMRDRRFQEFQARRQRREEDGIDIGDVDEVTRNANEAIGEIESGWSCVPGEYGRALQFVDPDFAPDNSSTAGCMNELEITSWKAAAAINSNAGLFDGGTDPDDVRGGRLNDIWFLSAISIVAASDGVDDGKVDALIDQLFVTKQTSMTGAYAIRFFKNSQWETVIVDDYLPCLDDTAGNEVNLGAAFAHSRGFEELWVPILEKAYAKYHGGYAALEHGYVHHALHDLTGAESEQIFLAEASRGANKKKLWKSICEYKKNKFLMGAGTISSSNADHEILDTGLVFGQCYVIYDCRYIDGNHLVKLRNPPGDHAEWRGDWGDDSDLWTRRLKKKLGWTDEDDNTFWMSFDDFCNAFRCLFVCKYYDPDRWCTYTMNSAFDEAQETSGGLPTVHNPKCILENNCQYALSVNRPSDVVITVSQVDSTGLAVSEVHPVAVYVVLSDQSDRATRVKSLTRLNVAAFSGEPRRDSQIELFCSLQARTYTILVAPYLSGMDGPFKIEIKSNFKVDFDQLWPAPWRAQKEPVTMAEKMAAKVKDKVNESGAMAKLNEKKSQYTSKIAAGANALDNAMKDETDVLEEQMAQASNPEKSKPKKSPWIEQYDESSGKPYYYNKKTQISSWDKPSDFETG